MWLLAARVGFRFLPRDDVQVSGFSILQACIGGTTASGCSAVDSGVLEPYYDALYQSACIPSPWGILDLEAAKHKKP